MFRYFEQLSSRIAAPFVAGTSRDSKVWQCRCGQSLFFRNSQCLACQALLGYRGFGALLALRGDGAVFGSVSGGCVEGAVITEALDVIDTGAAKMLEFGVADETAWRVGLSCGGRIRVYVERVD
mgnify:CR=1 FL=1